ncbi:autotransporter outer membrane beta-barrel domain-containing protein, partial [Pontiellaceae bacterium B12227]|nr:autotransporter outer membrane beta-barrel domain-containing protein [Pontiellaceae bacterium B12227]
GDTHLLISTNGLLRTGSGMLVTGSNSVVGVLAGGHLVNGGAFSMTGDDSIVVVGGRNSLLSAAGGMTMVGSNNSVIVIDNGVVETAGDFSVAGMGSSINIDSTSQLEATGNISLDGVRLEVANGGQMFSGGTLYNKNALAPSEILLRHGAVINATNYHQDAGAILNYDIGNMPTNLGILRIAGTAEFEAGAKLGLLGSLTNLALNTSYTNMLVSTELLIVGGRTNSISDDLALLDISGSTLVDFMLYVDNQDIYTILNRKSLGDTAGFVSGSMIGGIAGEIDRLSLNGNSAAANQIDILSGMTGSQQNQQLNQLYAYSLPTFSHAQSMLGGIDQVRARGRSAGTDAPAWSAPSGAAGPHAEDQGLQGWAKVYGGFGSRDEGDSDFQDGYDAQTFGTVVGLDQAFGSLLVGLAGGYAGSNLEGDNGDQSDAATGYGILYANYGAEDWFGDLVLGLGSMSMDNTSGTAFDTSSSVDASQASFYIGGGKEAVDERSGILLRALLGLQISQFSQDAYTETSTTAVGKDVDAYDRLSYRSKVGISIINPGKDAAVSLESDFRAFWLHEFNGDDEVVDYTLVGSDQSGQFIMRSPDQDVGLVGFGLMSKWDNGLRFRVDIDAQLSKHFYSTAFSGSLLYEF